MEVLIVISSDTPSTALRAWVVQVRISSRGSFVECKVVQGFLPSVIKAEKVKLLVSDKFIENETFIVEGFCVEEGEF